MNSLNLRVSSKLEESVKRNLELRTSPIKIPSSCDNINIGDGLRFKFQNSKSVTEQVQVIKENILITTINEDGIYFLTELCFSAPLKHPVRNQITKILLRTDEYLTVKFLSQSLKGLINIGETPSIEDVNRVISSMSGCFENFPRALKALETNLNVAFEFSTISTRNYVEAISNIASPSLRNECYFFIHNSIRVLLAIIQEFGPKLLLHQEENLKKLSETAYLIISNEEIPMDVKSNCGILLAYNAKLFDEFDNIMKEASNAKTVYDLSICVGVINIICQDNFNKFAKNYSDIVQRVSDIASIHCVSPNVLLSSSRSMLQISKVLATFQLNGAVTNETKIILNTLLKHSYAYLENHLDSVRHICKDVFSNVFFLANKMGFTEITSQIIRECHSDSSLSMKCVLIQQMVNVLGTKIIIEMIPTLFKNLFNSHLGKDLQVNKLFELMMVHNFKEENFEVWLNRWIVYLLSDKISGEGIEPLIEKGSKLDSKISAFIVKDCNISMRTKLAVIRNTRDENFPILLETLGQQFTLPLVVSCDDTKIMALKLLVESQKTTELLSKFDLDHILYFVKYNANCQSPATRQKMTGMLEKALMRLSLNLRKSKKCKNEHEIYTNFLMDFIKLLANNLFEGANFSRRSVSLLLIQKCVQIIVNEMLLMSDFVSTDIVNKLIGCFSDPYESNRRMAVAILELIDKSDEMFISLKNIKTLLLSIKPTDSVTAAYTLQYFCQACKVENFNIETPLPLYHPVYFAALTWVLNILKEGINLAERLVILAAVENPLYGCLFTLHHFLSKLEYESLANEQLWRNIISEIINLSQRLNEIVGPIVNNSSPEGHIPSDSGNVVYGNVKISSQLVLVCAWRTVKEVSLLLGEIVLKSPIKSAKSIDSKYLVTKNQVLEIGEHFKNLLLQTKHRGAFEQAYVGFSMVCCRFWRVSDDEIHSLPMQWLVDIIEIISKDDNLNEKICATRRSAGIPFIVQALITSELQVGTTNALNYCMTKLLGICSDKSRSSECRSHALNILRVLFRCSDLNESIIEFVSCGIKCAINGYEAKTWSEKNSSSLLFSALITRIFGVQRTKELDSLNVRNKMTGRIFFSRYPLYDYFMDELKKISVLVLQNKKSNKLHPLLLILSRLYPSALEGTESNLKVSDFIPFISICSGVPEMHTRHLVANSIVALLSVDSRENYIFGILILIKNENWLSLNMIHGLLLQAYYLLKINQCVVSSLRGEVISAVNHLVMTIRNAVILQTALEILILLLNVSSPCDVPQEDSCNLWKIEDALIRLTEKAAFYYPVFRKSLCIYNLHLRRVTRPTALYDYLLLQLRETKSLEQKETILNIILLLLCKSDVTDEFECLVKEQDFAKSLPEEIKSTLIQKLVRCPDVNSSLEDVINSKVYYPQCTSKAYAIFSKIESFNVYSMISEPKKLPESLKYSIAMCVTSSVKTNPKMYAYGPILDFLLDISQAWQKDSLRLQSVNILRHIYSDCFKFIINEDPQLTEKFITIVLEALIDDDSEIRSTVSKLVLDTANKNVPLENVNSTYALELFITEVLKHLDSTKRNRDFITYVTGLFLTFNSKVSLEYCSLKDDLEIFEKNEVNVFGEPYLVQSVCREILSKFNQNC